MFISLTDFIICSFRKKCQKLLPWQPFFFFTFQAYLPLFLPYMKAWRFLLLKLLQIFIKVQHNFSAISCKFWENCCHGNTFNLQFSLFAVFKNDSRTYNCKTFSYLSLKIGVYVRVHEEYLFLRVTLNSQFYKTYSDLNLKNCLFCTLPQNIP